MQYREGDYVFHIQKCGKPDCRRKVLIGVASCCRGCHAAAVDRVETDSHTIACDNRNHTRGFCTPEEAEHYAQDPLPVPSLGTPDA